MKMLKLAILFFSTIHGVAQPAHIVISQVYGGGGNSGALFTHDFIELFNPTPATLSLEGMSLQYSGATTATWSSNRIILAGSMAPGQYFLIQLGSGGPNGKALPTPDLVAPQVILNAGAGKLAVVSGSETLTGNCPATRLIDFVGYGGADCSESAAAPATANSTSLLRINNGCTDTENNALDFVVSVPDPRNATAHRHTCNGQQLIISSIDGVPFCIDSVTAATGNLSFAAAGTFSNARLQAVLSNAQGTFTDPVVVGSTGIDGNDPAGNLFITIPKGLPSATTYRLRLQSDDPALTGAPAPVEIINGARNADQLKALPNSGQLWLTWANPSGCFDEMMIVVKEGNPVGAVPQGDGTTYLADADFNGDGTPFDGGRVVYKGAVSGQLVIGLTNGKTYHVKAFTRRGKFWSTGIATAEYPRVLPLPGEVVINQLSPDFNGAQDEYIELVNLSGKTFDLSDLALRFTNADGRNVVAGGTLSGTMQPHAFWLLSPNASITVGKTTAMVPDQVIDGGFAGQNQQVGLLRKTDNVLIDAVAYGTVNVPTYMETAPAVNPPADGGLKRIIDGKDGNRNNQDFARVAQQDILLRNSQDLLAAPHAVVPAGTYRTIKVTGDAGLAGSATVTRQLILENGTFSIGNHDLVVDSVTGGAADSYVRTTGSGMLTIGRVSSTLFPVGNGTYNPVTIRSENTGWQVRVADTLPAAAPFIQAAALQRMWDLRPVSDPASGATIVFEYDDTDPLQAGPAFNPPAPVDIWNFQQPVWSRVVAGQLPAAAANGRKSGTLSSWKAAGSFSIANDPRPLPVKFSAFRATAHAASIELAFSSEAEYNVAHYEVERSPNGRNFYTLAIIRPLANNGSTANYSLMDKQPYPGFSFYRVKGIEKGGRSYFTQIIRASVVRTARVLSVLPSRITGSTLNWEATLQKGTWQAAIINSVGQEIVVQTIQHTGGTVYQSIAIPPGTGPGVYILQLRNNEKQLQQRFVVQ